MDIRSRTLLAVALGMLGHYGPAEHVEASQLRVSGRGGFHRLGRWDGFQRAVTLPSPLPETTPPGRRWRLHFPSDWRHPAILHPPIRVYLDPPYGADDPFAPAPYQAPAASAQTAIPQNAAQNRVTRSRPTNPGPKVLEFNRDTGQLEERALTRSSSNAESRTERPPDPPPAADAESEVSPPAPKEPSPSASAWSKLGRWDTRLQ
jgi:hypothetical protein